MVKVICKNCNKEFLHINRRKKFCASECYWDSLKGKMPKSPPPHLPTQNLVCPSCGIMFKKWPNRKYCSRKCLGIAQRKEEKQCLSCGISYVGSGKKFCSKKCQSSFMVKERSPTWKGGINKEKDRRKSFEGVKWRKAVFERDDYTCRMCGKKGGFIEADHIKPFCDYPELRYELSNGRTLCRGCHRGTDTYGRKRRFI